MFMENTMSPFKCQVNRKMRLKAKVRAGCAGVGREEERLNAGLHLQVYCSAFHGDLRQEGERRGGKG